MADPRFFTRKGPFTLQELAELTQASLPGGADASRLMRDVAALDRADAEDLSFFDNIKYLEQFEQSRAGACFARAKFAAQAPESLTVLIHDDPYRAYAMAAAAFYPAEAPNGTQSPHAIIAESASIGTGTQVDAGAVIGERVEIGEHCHIATGAVIGDGVRIGNRCRIGANAVLSHCELGHEVAIYRGVMIGQDGFGFAMGAGGHLKVPQLGRVIIEDGVEIGANSCIDRGAGPDTIIGAGTKIDNLVQIGHNVQIGKGCVIVSQVGISGSTQIGNGVVIGGQAGIAGHLNVGDGVMLAARTGVMKDLDAGQTYGGIPAVPIKDWHRQGVALNNLIKKKRSA